MNVFKLRVDVDKSSAFLFAMMLLLGYSGAMYYSGGDLAFGLAASMAVFISASIVASILLHEVAHAAAASAMGMEPLWIRVIPIGMMLEIRGFSPARCFTHPGKAFFIYSAGPLSNVAIALAICLPVGGLSQADFGHIPSSPIEASLHIVAIANLSLAVFNMIPLSFMDGGGIMSCAIGFLSRRQVRFEFTRYAANAITLPVFCYLTASNGMYVASAILVFVSLPMVFDLMSMLSVSSYNRRVANDVFEGDTPRFEAASSALWFMVGWLRLHHSVRVISRRNAIGLPYLEAMIGRRSRDGSLRALRRAHAAALRLKGIIGGGPISFDHGGAVADRMILRRETAGIGDPDVISKINQTEELTDEP